MQRVTRRRLLGISCALLLLLPPAAAAQSDYALFESGPVRPLALSADGNRLFAANTPGNQLEIFAVGPSGELTRTATVTVGLEPVAVAVRSASEVWVVNHLSDSVSIVDVGASPPRVVRTLLVGDEPRDIVFGGAGFNRAFVTTAHRGQNIGFNPRFTADDQGRCDVWVFDANNLGASLGGTPIEILDLFGDTPRALAVTPDGATVYAAVFHSGNQTTTLNEQIVCDGGANAGPCVVDGLQVPGGLPAPNANFEGIPGPEVGLIVQYKPGTGRWEDELGRDWSNGVRFDLPDYDVFAIDANATPPVQSNAFSRVGTINFNMVVHPTNGKVYVSNTEANNATRFEGPGTISSTVRGRLHQARITVIDGANVESRLLNKHINYGVANPPAGVRNASLATPTDMAISSDGSTLYVAAFGSNKVGVFQTAEIDGNSFVPSANSHITIPGGLPGGLALHEGRNRLYVLSRFDNAISAIDLSTRAEAEHVALYNPESFAIVEGRRFLYDAQLTSGNGEASCAACHVFGDLDDLAWDLGNPDESVLVNLNPFRLGPLGDPNFHPMKGPMTTQTLRGMDTHGPMHWRGDRSGANDPGGSAADEFAAFMRFNPAFEGLIGRKTELSHEEMAKFTEFILQVKLPPNPIRNLDNSLTAQQQAGRDFYFGPISDTVFNCNGCHVLNPAQGFFGTDGQMTFEGETQHFKVAHLRNVYTKIGMFGMPDIPGIQGGGNNNHRGDQIRGFGVLHDGSVDGVFRFISGAVFQFPGGGPQKREVESFMFAFDTNLAPVVGQQITLTDSNAGVADPRVDLLVQRAAAGECDLVVKGTIAGEPRGAVRLPSGDFQTDRSGDAPLTEVALRALATTPGQALTFTAVPPGSGHRIGIDRDRDGALDGDELDAGTDPGSDLSLPPSALTCTAPVAISRPVLRIVRNDGAAGDERLTLKGEIVLPPGSLDARAEGFRFKILDKDGLPLFQRAVGRGDPPSKNAPGWIENRARTRATYKDRFAAASDVFKIVLRESTASPGTYKFTLNGKNGDFQVSPTALPLSVVVVPGGPEEGAAGLCGAHTFNPDGGARPSCRASGTGATISCS